MRIIPKYYRIAGWVLIVLFGAKDLIGVFQEYMNQPSIDLLTDKKFINYSGMLWKMFFSFGFDIFIWIGAILIWKADHFKVSINTNEQNSLEYISRKPAQSLNFGKLLIIFLLISVLSCIGVFAFCIFIMSVSG